MREVWVVWIRCVFEEGGGIGRSIVEWSREKLDIVYHETVYSLMLNV